MSAATTVAADAEKQDAEKKDPEKKVAVAYFEALVNGDEARANTLASVPYSLRRKTILSTKAEVEATHKEFAESREKGKFPNFTVARTDKAAKLDANIFPAYVVFRVTITVRDNKEYIDIYVTKGKSPMVIGFNDSVAKVKSK